MLITIFVTIYLSIMSFYDCRERKVPTVGLMIGGAAEVGYTVCQIASGGFLWLRFITEFLPAVAPGCALLLVAWGTKKACAADGVILLELGLLTGYRKCIFIFCVSLLLISIFCGILLFLRKTKKNSRIPYLPFILLSFIFIGIL